MLDAVGIVRPRFDVFLHVGLPKKFAGLPALTFTMV